VRKRVFLTATWLAATTLAIGVTWLALTLVSRQVTDESSNALDASRVLAASSTTGLETPTTPATTITGETLVTLPLQPGAIGSTSTRPPAGTTGATSPPATTGTTSGTTPPTTTPTTAAPPATVTKTFNLVGGSVTASCTDDRAALVSAVPNATFDTQVHDNGPSDVDVEFESATHKSRIKIECVANQPTGDVEETATS
jgi:hypothetical protein